MNSEFVDILNNHRALIYKVCNLYCTDRDDKEDLFQEIVIQVWKSLTEAEVLSRDLYNNMVVTG